MGDDGDVVVVQVLCAVRAGRRQARLPVGRVGGAVDPAAHRRRRCVRRVPVDGDAPASRRTLPRPRRRRPPDALERGDGSRLQRPLDADGRAPPLPLRPAQPTQLYLHLNQPAATISSATISTLGWTANLSASETTNTFGPGVGVIPKK